jgi:hypothetical protein
VLFLVVVLTGLRVLKLGRREKGERRKAKTGTKSEIRGQNRIF